MNERSDVLKALAAFKSNAPARQGAGICSDARDNAVDIAIIRYVDAEYDRINCKSEDGGFAKFKNNWEEIAHNDMAEKLKNGDMSVQDLCSGWMLERSRSGISKRTAECEKRICSRYVIPTAGDIICRDIDRDVVKDIVFSIIYRSDEDDEEGMIRGTTARVYLSSLNSLLEYGHRISAVAERFKVYINIREK